MRTDVLIADAGLEIALNLRGASVPLWLLQLGGRVCQACLQEGTQNLMTMCVLVLAMLLFIPNVFLSGISCSFG